MKSESNLHQISESPLFPQGGQAEHPQMTQPGKQHPTPTYRHHWGQRPTIQMCTYTCVYAHTAKGTSLELCELEQNLFFEILNINERRGRAGRTGCCWAGRAHSRRISSLYCSLRAQQLGSSFLRAFLCSPHAYLAVSSTSATPRLRGGHREGLISEPQRLQSVPVRISEHSPVPRHWAALCHTDTWG